MRCSSTSPSQRRELAAALLAAAGRVLAGPGSVDERLRRSPDLTWSAADWASVWLRGDDAGTGRRRPPRPTPRPVLAWAVGVPELAAEFRAGRAFAVGASDGMRREATTDDGRSPRSPRCGGASWLAAPLVNAGRVVGADPDGAAQQRRYDEADVALAEDLGQRLATMVAAERLAARERQLQEITVALSAAGTVAEAAAALTAGLRDALGATVVAVCTLGDDGRLHTVDVVGAPPGGWERLRHDAADRRGAAARRRAAPAARSGCPTGRPWPSGTRLCWTARARDRPRRIAALPLLVGDRVVGALAVTFRTPRPFDPDERAFLLTVADQVAVAFERAAPGRRPPGDGRDPAAQPAARRAARPSTGWRSPPATCPAVGRHRRRRRLVRRPAARRRRASRSSSATSSGTGARRRGDGPAAQRAGGLLLDGHSPRRRRWSVLDRFAGQRPGARMSTVGLPRARPGRRPAVLQLAPGIRRRCCSTRRRQRAGRYLEGGRGPVLGLPGARPPARGSTDRDAPGATLVLLYTDGLVERRGAALDEGLERLAAAADRPAVGPAAGARRRRPRRARGRLRRPDDIAVVAVRLLPAPAAARPARRAACSWA